MRKSTKPSKRGTVRKAFEKGGEATAIAKGEELGVRASRVRRWIRIWTRKAAPKPEPEPEGKRERPTTKPGHFDEGDNVVIIWNTDLVAKVTRKGPEQSEIKFKNGNYLYLPNRELARSKREPTKYGY